MALSLVLSGDPRRARAVSFKNRVGNFLLLAGAIGLFLFAASVAAGTGSYDITALAVGVLLSLVGLRWRLTRGAPPALPPPPAPRRAAKAARAPARPAPAPGADRSAAPKKRGPLGTLLRGPAKKK